MGLIKTIIANLPKNKLSDLLFSGILFILYFFPIGPILALKTPRERKDSSFVNLSEYPKH